MTYTKPQQRKKEEGDKLRGERDQIKFVNLRFQRWQVVGFRKARRKQDVSAKIKTKHLSYQILHLMIAYKFDFK